MKNKRCFKEGNIAQAVATKPSLLKKVLCVSCAASTLFLITVLMTKGFLGQAAIAFVVVPILAGYFTYLITKKEKNNDDC